MNENIKRLLAQAYLEQADIRDTTKIAEHFAELIIEECAKQAEYNGYNQMFGQGGLRTKLHKHFGIKE